MFGEGLDGQCLWRGWVRGCVRENGHNVNFSLQPYLTPDGTFSKTNFWP